MVYRKNGEHRHFALHYGVTGRFSQRDVVWPKEFGNPKKELENGGFKPFFRGEA